MKALGADYVQSADLLLSMQWFGPRLWERPASALRGQRGYQLTLLARQEFADGTLQLEGLGLYGVSDGDSTASASITRARHCALSGVTEGHGVNTSRREYDTA